MRELFEMKSMEFSGAKISAETIRGFLEKGDSKNMKTREFEAFCEHINELRQRLARVRSWGGAYADIDFSPDMQAITKIVCDDADCVDRDIDTVYT